MALILKQESAAEEKRQLQEQMTGLKKSYFEAVMVRMVNGTHKRHAIYAIR